MLRQQSDTTASFIPSATGASRRSGLLESGAFRPLRPNDAAGALAAPGSRASSRVLLSPFFDLDIFSGTGRRSVLPEPTRKIVEGGYYPGSSPVPFSQKSRLFLLAGCTDPYRTFPVLSCAKRVQPLRNTGAPAPVHCYPCGDAQRRDRPTRNDRSRPGLPIHHSGECAALTCYREGGRPERSTPSHSPTGFPKHSYIYSTPLFYHPQGADAHDSRRRSHGSTILTARRFRRGGNAGTRHGAFTRELRPLFFSRHFVQSFFHIIKVLS